MAAVLVQRGGSFSIVLTGNMFSSTSPTALFFFSPSLSLTLLLQSFRNTCLCLADLMCFGFPFVSWKLQLHLNNNTVTVKSSYWAVRGAFCGMFVCKNSPTENRVILNHVARSLAYFLLYDCDSSWTLTAVKVAENVSKLSQRTSCLHFKQKQVSAQWMEAETWGSPSSLGRKTTSLSGLSYFLSAHVFTRRKKVQSQLLGHVLHSTFQLSPTVDATKK